MPRAVRDPGARWEPVTADHSALRPGEMVPPGLTTPASRLEDFSPPWCQAILKDPKWEHIPFGWLASQKDQDLLNAFWNQTLSTSRGLRAAQGLRPSETNTDADAPDAMLLMSLGPDLEGAPGKLHGGFIATALDMVTGFAVHSHGPTMPVFTGALKVDYKKSFSAPILVIAKGWVTKFEGRKRYVRGTFEDGAGNVAATAEALYIAPKPKL